VRHKRDVTHLGPQDGWNANTKMHSEKLVHNNISIFLIFHKYPTYIVL